MGLVLIVSFHELSKKIQDLVLQQELHLRARSFTESQHAASILDWKSFWFCTLNKQLPGKSFSDKVFMACCMILKFHILWERGKVSVLREMQPIHCKVTVICQFYQNFVYFVLILYLWTGLFTDYTKLNVVKMR